MVMFGEAAFSAKFVAGEGGGDSASFIRRTFLSLVTIMLYQSTVRHVIVTTLGLFLSAYLIFLYMFCGLRNCKRVVMAGVETRKLGIRSVVGPVSIVPQTVLQPSLITVDVGTRSARSHNCPP